MSYCVQVQGAVFDLPEEIAKELLNKEIPPGNTLSKITKVNIVDCLVWLYGNVFLHSF